MSKSYSYPATLTPDADGRLTVSFTDLAEALTDGANFTEALAEAEDCLSEAIQGRIDDGVDIPEPSPATHGQVMVPVEIITALKAEVHNRMNAQGVRQVQLAAAMGVASREVRRILDPRHGTSARKLESAMHALGGKVTLIIEDEDTAQVA